MINFSAGAWCARFPRAIFRFGVLPVLALLAAGTVQADELQPPQQVIKQVSDQLNEVLQTDRERLENDMGYVFQLADEILIPHVDFDRLSRLVLGKYWKRDPFTKQKTTVAQRERFKDEFRQMLVRTYATAFYNFDEWEIRFRPLHLRDGENDVIVRTEIIQPSAAQPVSVDYRMRLNSDEWKAYDVKIEGISLVTNYRNSFSRQIKRGGMDKLIERLSALNRDRVKAHAAEAGTESGDRTDDASAI